MFGEDKENKLSKTEEVDVLSVLRQWIDKNLENGRIRPEIFVKNHKPYRFTLRRGDEEISHETKNHA